MHVYPVLFILVLVVVALAAIAKRSQNGGAKIPNFEKRALLTGNELEFFQRLVRAAPEGYLVAPQVAMGAVLDVHKAVGKDERRAKRNKFDRKVIDFVLFHGQTGGIAVLIELDDRMHDSEKDAARDLMTSEAGYRTIRYQSRAKPEHTVLQAVLADAARAAALSNSGNKHLK